MLSGIPFSTEISQLPILPIPVRIGQNRAANYCTCGRSALCRLEHYRVSLGLASALVILRSSIRRARRFIGVHYIAGRQTVFLDVTPHRQTLLLPASNCTYAASAMVAVH